VFVSRYSTPTGPAGQTVFGGAFILFDIANDSNTSGPTFVYDGAGSFTVPVSGEYFVQISFYPQATTPGGEQYINFSLEDLFFKYPQMEMAGTIGQYTTWNGIVHAQAGHPLRVINTSADNNNNGVNVVLGVPNSGINATAPNMVGASIVIELLAPDTP
jgi:hypothetical protein